MAVLVLVAIASTACSSAARPPESRGTTSGPSITTATLPLATAPTASAALSWSAPQLLDSNPGGLFSVSCPSANFCVAVGGTGPGSVGSAYVWNGTSWSARQPLNQSDANHVSCPAASFCLAGAPDGTAMEWNGTAWASNAKIRWPDPNDGIIGVSCASASFCVAPDEDGDMRIWNGTAWAVKINHGAHSVSCPSSTFCMGVEGTMTLSWNGSSFSTPQPLAPDMLDAVSCPTAAFCMALASGDEWFVWNGGSWSAPTPIATVTPGPNPAFINWVSCATAIFCVAVLSDGHALTWNGTSWSVPQWIDQNLANAVGPAATSSNSHPAQGMQSVSCPTASFCVAVGTDGRAVIGQKAS
jgi:hypothetical protein